jgi:hypothetical protein
MHLRASHGRQGRLDGEKHRQHQSNGLENLFHDHPEIWSLSMCSVGDVRHIVWVRKGYTVDSSQMGRLSKSAFLVVLLLLAGVPGYASRLCDMPSSSHAHYCCMGHDQQTAPLSGATNTASWGSSCCCKVVPLGSVTISSSSPSVRSYEGTHGAQATNAVALDLPLPTIRSNRGSPHSVKLRHSPVHALLCTFLV